MFWTACTIAYFGFLRSAEFTVSSLANFADSIHMGIQDIAVDAASNPTCLQVRIKASKTNPFCKGCFIHIGKGNYPLCAIQTLLAYLAIRGNSVGPLFLLQDGWPLSRTLLTSQIRQILTTAGVPSNFPSHSFRIDAATVAAHNGVPDHLIQALGHWSSDAYRLYICTPLEALARLSCLVPLSRTLLVSWIRQILTTAGVSSNFSSHSFRIDAATVAARNKVPGHLIQAFGHWSSDAYRLYICTPLEALARLSCHLF